MADVKKEVLIDIVVSNENAVRGIIEAQNAVAELKEEEKRLKQQYDEGIITLEDYQRKMVAMKAAAKEYGNVIRANEKELSNNIKQQKEASDSLVALRAELSNLTREYDNLSKAERESAQGKEMLSHIQGLSNELMMAEAESKRFQRNVGNYPSMFNVGGSAAGKFAQAVSGLAGGATTMGQAVKNSTAVVKMFGKELISLMSIPIVAVISAIAVVVLELVKAFKKNDDAMTALQDAFAVFSPIVDGIRFVFEKLVQALTSVIKGFADAAAVVARIIPKWGDAVEKNRELVKAADELEEAERQHTEKSAARELEISKLRDKTAQKDKYSAKERQQMLLQAQKLERDNMRESVAIANEKVRIAEAEMKRNKDTSDEAKNNLSQLKAAALQAQKEYYDGSRKLQKEYQAALREDEEEQKKAEEDRKAKAKAAAEKRKQQLAEQEQEMRKFRELVIEAMTDPVEKSIAQINAKFDNQIADIRKKIKDGGITSVTRDALNQQIVWLEKLRRKEIEAVEGAATAALDDEKLADQKAAAEKLLKEQLQTEKDAKAAEKAALLKMSAEWDKRLTELELGNAYEREAGKTRIAEEQARQRLATARSEYSKLEKLNDEQIERTYGSEAAYQAALAEANLKVIQGEGEVARAARATANAFAEQQRKAVEGKIQIASAVGGISETLQGLVEGMAENDERYADFATGMALMNILISTAISIANAIQGATAAAAATGPGAPIATPIFIAEMVGIVASGIASATATLMKAKQQKQRFSSGGYVSGAGTGTSDSIDARLSNGEFVMNAASTKRFLPALVAMNGGWGNTGGRSFAAGGLVSYEAATAGYNSQFVADTIAETVASIRPVVSVKEIARVSNRVSVKESISKR